jgi:hypothetical protein
MTRHVFTHSFSAGTSISWFLAHIIYGHGKNGNDVLIIVALLLQI